MFCSSSKINRLVPTLGEDLLLAVLNYPGCLFYRQSTMISVGRLSLLTLPSGLTILLPSVVFFLRSFARGLECFAQVFVVLRWSLATITCVKQSVGPVTHEESYGQVHKCWCICSCLPFGNCKCYYLYFVKC